MNLENQTSLFGQSKKLLELGVLYPDKTFAWVKDESEFYDKNDDPDFYLRYCDGYEWTEHPGYQDYKVIIPAFTVSELGMMLPCYAWAVPIYQGELNPNSDVFQEVKIALSLYHPECRIESLGDPNMVWKFICSPVLAWAMADMLIFLLEGGFVSINDVNERLSS